VETTAGVNLLGVELCYAASANAILSPVNLNTTTHVTDVTDSTVRAADQTDRTDEACRYYAGVHALSARPL
jgi:hypothetical protein